MEWIGTISTSNYITLSADPNDVHVVSLILHGIDRTNSLAISTSNYLTLSADRNCVHRRLSNSAEALRLCSPK